MYIGVVAVGIIGTALSRFTPAGMGRTMFAMTIALLIVAAIALLTIWHNIPAAQRLRSSA